MLDKLNENPFVLILFAELGLRIDLNDCVDWIKDMVWNFGQWRTANGLLQDLVYARGLINAQDQTELEMVRDCESLIASHWEKKAAV